MRRAWTDDGRRPPAGARAAAGKPKSRFRLVHSKIVYHAQHVLKKVLHSSDAAVKYVENMITVYIASNKLTDTTHPGTFLLFGS